jgi:hypothetical protein
MSEDAGDEALFGYRLRMLDYAGRTSASEACFTLPMTTLQLKKRIRLGATAQQLPARRRHDPGRACEPDTRNPVLRIDRARTQRRPRTRSPF